MAKHPRNTKSRRGDRTHPLMTLADLAADPEKLLSQQEAGQYLGKSTAWFERCRWSRTGPKFVKVGRSVYYRSGDLLDFVRAGTVETTTQRAA